MTTVIMPVTTTREVDCIVQDGVRYCEKTDVPPEAMGVILLSVAVFFCWAGVWIWLDLEDHISSGFGVFMAIIFPLLVFGIILI